MFSNNVPGADSICGLKPDCTALQRGQHGQHVDGAKMRRLSLQSETFAHYLCPSPCQTFVSQLQPLSDLCISAPAPVRPFAPVPVRPLYLSSSPCQTFMSQLQPLSDLCISAPALVRPLYLSSSPCQTFVSLLQRLSDLGCSISAPALVRPLYL